MTRDTVFFFVGIILVLSAPSCVTKKKYLALNSQKLSADSTVLVLNGVVDSKNKRIETMIADFGIMKNELMESNAIKNHVIDSLAGVVNHLNKDVNLKESAIGEKMNSFEFERRQLSEDLAAQKQLFGKKQLELNQMAAEFQKIKDEYATLSFDLSREKDEKQLLQGNLSLRETKISELSTAAEKLKKEIQSLKKQVSDKNETITRLENNVKLLKEQLK